MATTIHEYPVTVRWTGGREGSGAAKPAHSGFEIPIAVPPEFQGPGGATNPEELLTTSIVACYTITFGIIAANRKLPVKSMEVEAVGEVEQNGAQFTFKAVTIKPSIVLESTATDDQMKIAEDMAHKADAYCIITNAVRGKVEIRLEASISKG